MFGRTINSPEASEDNKRSLWGPLLIHVGPPFCGKREFISSLGEPVQEIIADEIAGLYQHISTEHALLIWQDKATPSILSTNSTAVRLLKVNRSWEMMLLALYFTNNMSKRDFLDRIKLIILDPFLLGEFMIAFEKICEAKPKLVATQLDILQPNAIPNVLSAGLKPMKDAIKRNKQLISWDDSNLVQMYAYSEVLTMAEKYNRVVRFVRWNQEIAPVPFHELIRKNILMFLENGRYIDTVKMGKSLKLCLSLLKNEHNKKMTHEDYARSAGFWMNESGLVTHIPSYSNTGVSNSNTVAGVYHSSTATAATTTTTTAISLHSSNSTATSTHSPIPLAGSNSGNSTHNNHNTSSPLPAAASSVLVSPLNAPISALHPKFTYEEYANSTSNGSSSNNNTNNINNNYHSSTDDLSSTQGSVVVVADTSSPPHCVGSSNSSGGSEEINGGGENSTEVVGSAGCFWPSSSSSYSAPPSPPPPQGKTGIAAARAIQQHHKITGSSNVGGSTTSPLPLGVRPPPVSPLAAASPRVVVMQSKWVAAWKNDGPIVPITSASPKAVGKGGKARSALQLKGEAAADQLVRTMSTMLDVNNNSSGSPHATSSPSAVTPGGSGRPPTAAVSSPGGLVAGWFGFGRNNKNKVDKNSGGHHQRNASTGSSDAGYDDDCDLESNSSSSSPNKLDSHHHHHHHHQSHHNNTAATTGGGGAKGRLSDVVAALEYEAMTVDAAAAYIGSTKGASIANVTALQRNNSAMELSRTLTVEQLTEEKEKMMMTELLKAEKDNPKKRIEERRKLIDSAIGAVIKDVQDMILSEALLELQQEKSAVEDDARKQRFAGYGANRGSMLLEKRGSIIRKSLNLGSSPIGIGEDTVGGGGAGSNASQLSVASCSLNEDSDHGGDDL